MNRFYVTAAIAVTLLAAGCQKTYVVDPVNQVIGFSTEVGKQTKAGIIQNGDSFDSESFGVVAYGLTEGKTWANGFAEKALLIDNKEVKKSTGEGEDNKWRVVGNDKYYWPNDAQSSLSFFAYYPYQSSTIEDATKTIGQKPGVDENGITLTAYKHIQDNIQKVDFMTADAKDKTYSSTNNGVVSLNFSHRMTQICFDITKDASASGAEVKIISIKLLGINNTADFSNSAFSNPSGNADYVVNEYSGEAGVVIEDTWKSTPCTMIPQTFAADKQKIEIKYSLSGTGIVSETVTKTVNLSGLSDTHTKWDAGQKVTYKMTVGLKEITFDPEIIDWSTGTPENPNEITIN